MSANNRVLVLAPHTDDGELGCGGTISRMVEEGREVYYAAFSTAAVGGGLLDVGRVPVDDGGDDEVQRHDAFLLGLVRPVVDAALGMREHGPGEGMSRASPLLSPAWHSMRSWGLSIQSSMNSVRSMRPNLAEREIQAVLLAVGAELAQHRRGRYGHGFDTGRQPQSVVPMLEHDLLVDRLAHKGGEFVGGSVSSCQPWPGWRRSAMWSASPRRFSGRRRVPIKSRSSSASR